MRTLKLYQGSTLLDTESIAAGQSATTTFQNLNFKISQGTKKRVKQLAVRDNITLLVMFDRMLELYEREYGKLGK